MSRWIYLAITACLLAALGVWLFPWGASAYYVEQAGRKLSDSQGPRYGEAQDALRRALRWDATNAQAYRLLAQVYEAQGDWQGRIQALAQYVTLRPRDPLEHWQLAVACEQLTIPDLEKIAGGPCGSEGMSRQAAVIQLWQRAGQTAAGFVRDGDALREQGASVEAEAFYRRALLLDADAVAAWHGLAQVVGEPEAELDAWGQVARLRRVGAVPAGENAELLAAAHSRRGEILAQQGRWAEASNELAEAVSLAPRVGVYHLDYGWYLAQGKTSGSSERAWAELETAAVLMPGNPWPSLRLAMVAFAEGDYEATVERAGQAIEDQRDLFWAWVWHGHGLTHLGRLSQGEASFRHALELAPQQAAPHGGLGRTLLRQGRIQEAIAELERAVSLAPDEFGYLLGLADAYRAAGHADEAAAAYRRVLELQPGNSAAVRALQEMGY